MTHADMLREARAIVPPAGATKAVAVHDQGHYRAAFLIGGRVRSAPVGPSFAKPRAVCAFVDILNGDDRPASRPGPDDFAGLGSSTSEDTRVQPEAPAAIHPAPPGSDPGVSVLDPDVVSQAASGVRTCEICGNRLPLGSRSHRRTDTSACRRALARREADAGRADDQGADAVVPLSRASDATSPAAVLARHVDDVIRACNPDLPFVPTSPAAERGGYALLSAAEDAGPGALPGVLPSPGDLTFGLS